jgi:hypothetical protein
MRVQCSDGLRERGVPPPGTAGRQAAAAAGSTAAEVVGSTNSKSLTAALIYQVKQTCARSQGHGASYISKRHLQPDNHGNRSRAAAAAVGEAALPTRGCRCLFKSNMGIAH